MAFSAPTCPSAHHRGMSCFFIFDADALERIAARSPGWENDAALCYEAAHTEAELHGDPDLRIWAALLKRSLLRNDAHGVAHALRGLLRTAMHRSATRTPLPHAAAS